MPTAGGQGLFGLSDAPGSGWATFCVSIHPCGRRGENHSGSVVTPGRCRSSSCTGEVTAVRPVWVRPWDSGTHSPGCRGATGSDGHFGKQPGRFLKSSEAPRARCDRPSPGRALRGTRAGRHTDAGARGFSAASSTTAKWKRRLTSPSASVRRNKRLSLAPVECDSAMKRGGALTPATTWANRENTMLRERCRTQRAPRC